MAEANLTLSRRAALAGIASLASVPALAAVPTPSSVNELWERRQRLLGVAQKLTTDYDAANAMLPEWMQSGPSRIDGYGRYCGPVCGWPRDETIGKATFPGAFRICRWSPTEIRHAFDSSLAFSGASSRPRHRAVYRARMRRLVELLRAQRDEKHRLGLFEIEAAQEANYEAIHVVDDGIHALALSQETTAARILLALIQYGHRDDTINNDGGMHIASIAIEPMRSCLSGILRQHVDQFLVDRDCALSKMLFWG